MERPRHSLLLPILSARTLWQRHGLLIAIVLLATLLRAWAALRLPVDLDEPVYVGAAFDYARALNAGDLNAVVDYPGNREHPALVKLLYSGAVLALGPNATWGDALMAARGLSAFFGVLGVLTLALVDPLAGGILAVDTLAVKYTSEAYLEALPLFTALVAVLALYRATKGSDRLLWLSAFALGLTGAGKFTYFPILFVVLYLLWEKKLEWRQWVTYLALAGLTSLFFNPTLWHDPAARLFDALSYHFNYQQGSEVERLAYPWFQPLVWISQSVPWHPEVFFYHGLDEFFFPLALAGLYLEWRARRWVLIWFVTSLAVLFVWATKWPQYTLVLIPALCLSAAEAARRGWHWVYENETYWGWLREMLPRPSRAWWIAAAAFLLFLAAIYAGGAVQLAVGRVGWSHYTSQNSDLPSNFVYAILARPDGEMVLGTERGAASWSPADTGAVDPWRVFNTANSGLASDRVLALAEDRAGALWLGTEGGLSRYDSNGWKTFLAQDRVQSIALGNGGQVWVGTRRGAAVFDGGGWTKYTTANSGLVDDYVLSLAVAAGPQGDVIWFGTNGGISRYDSGTGEWVSLTGKNSDVGWGGVADLMVDADGRLWAATLGGGIAVREGGAWRSYRVSNSGLRFNEVQKVLEAERGVYWIGTVFPTQTGGSLTRFDGAAWRTFSFNNSGYSGAEPLALARDAQGRVWIGTRGAGVDIYQPE